MPNLDPITGFPIPQQRDNHWLDKLSAGFALSNPISGAIDAAYNKPDAKKEPVGTWEYDPFADPQTKGYDPSQFTESMSKEQTYNIIKDIDYNRELYERSQGTMGMVGQIGGVVGNPFITIPALLTGGSSIPTMMAAEAGGEILSEVLLHSQQPLRTKTESMINIGLATGAAGLGGYVHKRLAARSAPSEPRTTAHGGDGMYAHPIPDEAVTEAPAVVRAGAEPVVEVGARAEREQAMAMNQGPKEETLVIYTGRNTAPVSAESRPMTGGIGIHFAPSEDTARIYAETQFEAGGNAPGFVSKTEVDDSKFLKLDEIPPSATPDQTDEILDGEPWTLDFTKLRLVDAGLPEEEVAKITNTDELWEYLDTKGYQGIKYDNVIDAEREFQPETWYIMGKTPEQMETGQIVDGKVTYQKPKPEIKGTEEGAGRTTSGPIGSLLQRIAPAGDVLAKSESPTARETIENLVDVPYRFDEAGKAVPQSVETKIHQAEGDWAAMKQMFDDEYLRYKKKGGDLTPEEFDVEVARAMRQGDQHEIPEVAATAAYFRKFDQQYFDRAVKLGLYGDEPPVLKGSKSHLQRVYVRERIIEGYDALRVLLKGKIAKSLARTDDYVMVRYYDNAIDETVSSYVHAKQLPAVEEMHPDMRVVTGREITSQGEEAINSTADQIARSTISRMLGGEPVDIAHLDYIVPRAGSVHERTLTLLDDTELEPYLNNSATEVMSITARQMHREIEMVDTFGSRTLADQVKKIHAEYDDLIAKAADKKERTALLKRRDKDVRTIQGLRDVILGTYGVPKDPTSALVTTGRSLRIMAMLSYGANITSSSLSDLVSPSLRHGLEPFRHGLKVLFSGITREQIKYVNRIGLAVESLTSARAAAFTEMAFNTKRGHKALHAFGKWTGLNKFTDLTQGLNAIGTMEMWINQLRQLDTLSEKKLNKLADVGIDRTWGKRIINQVRQHGTKRNGVTLPEVHLWDDVEAARRFENALRKEVLTTTLMPGKADVPLFAKTEQGKFFTMFMSFMLSSTQRWIVAGMQRADIEFLQGMLMISVAGGMVNYAKALATGRELSDDPVDHILEAMDRGGALGIMSLPVGWARSFIYDGDSSSQVGRGMVEQFAMPAGARYAQELSSLLLKVASNEEMSEDDIWRMMKAVPLANSFHFIDLSKQMVGD